MQLWTQSTWRDVPLHAMLMPLHAKSDGRNGLMHARLSY